MPVDMTAMSTFLQCNAVQFDNFAQKSSRDISATPVLHLTAAYLPAVASVVSCQEAELAARRKSLLLLGAAVAPPQRAPSLRTDTAAV
jgi:hypothetical protein